MKRFASKPERWDTMNIDNNDLAMATVLAVIAAIAILSNILVFALVCRNVWIMHPTNVYVLGLAGLDILTASIPLPMNAVVLATGRWPLGDATCAAYGFFNEFVVVASIFTLFLVAIDRFYEIIKPREYREIFTVGKRIAILIGIWVGAALFCTFPVYSAWAHYKFSLPRLGCVLHFDVKAQQSMWAIAFLVASIPIPTYVMFHSYLPIFSSVRRRRNRIVEEGVLFGAQNMGWKKVRLAKTFFIVSLVFVISWLPASCTLLVGELVTGQVFQVGTLILKDLLALSAASKIFVYLGINRSFRRALLNLICRVDT